MKKALIITYYWPPAGGSGVQRWLKFVKYFREFGIEPVVFTVENPSYPIIDESLQYEIPKDIEIISQPIWEPNNIFSIFNGKSTESAGFLNAKPSLFGKFLQYVRANFFIPDARKYWVKPSVNKLEEYLKTNKIDVLITTGPPHSVHLIGLNLKQRLNISWIADFRDPWTDIDYFHQLPLTKKSLKKHFKLEKEVVSKADAVIVVGKTMGANYNKFNDNIITITNGFDGASVEGDTALDLKFTMTHIGLMNADRNPQMIWQVLSEICQENSSFKKDFQLKLVGKVDASIISDIAKYDLNAQVQIINYLPNNEVLTYQQQSQVLLLIVNDVPSARGIITGKVFEYLMAKRPILAIAPTDGDLFEIIENSKSGIVINFRDAVQLKKTILNLYKDFQKGNLSIQSKNIEQYHRRELTKKVSELIYQITT